MTGSQLRKIREQYKENQTEFYVKRLKYSTREHGARLEGYKTRSLPERTVLYVEAMLKMQAARKKGRGKK